MSANAISDLSTKSWLPHQRMLIYLVKKNPVIYYPSPTKRHTKLAKTEWDNAWTEIAMQSCQSIQTCKKLWTKIKLKYAKILILVNTGKITKEAAMSHPETSRFFDGLLSFVDPFISKITDETIPFSIHKLINDIFGLKTIETYRSASKESYTQFVTHAQVKALLRERQSNEEQNLEITEPEYLQIVVNTAIRRKLGELLNKDDLSNPSDDTITIRNDPRMPSKDLRNVRKTVNLGLSTELIIEDDIKSEAEDDNIKMEDDDDVKEENLTLNKKILVNNATDEKYNIENILPSSKIIIPVIDDTMTNTISSLNNDVIADNNEPPSDDYIRNFFNELGEVMSLELSITKQNTLKSQINELVKDILLNEKG